MTKARLAACTLVLFLLFRCISYAAGSDRCDTRTATGPVLCGNGPNAVSFAVASDDRGPEAHRREDLETTPEKQATFLASIVSLARCISLGEVNRCETHSATTPVLCSHEPNTVGFTKDSDDSGFMDFKLSVQYQLFPKGITSLFQWLHDSISLSEYPAFNSALYLAFTGRFGQYIETRDSSPVVSKRFNPKVFYRLWTDPDHEEYFDLAFLAHESNGQSIDSESEYQAALSTMQKPEFANDHLSRGWDYLELVWKKTLKKVEHQRALYSYMSLKHFLQRGPMQKGAEEYNAWENDPEGKPRNYVNGIAGMLKYHERGVWLTLFDTVVFQDIKVALAYETGTHQPFRYSTGRMELGMKIFQLPVTLWGQRGYNSDLAQYFKRVNSYGIQLDIGSF